MAGHKRIVCVVRRDPIMDALNTLAEQRMLDTFFNHTDEGCAICEEIEQRNQAVERGEK